MSESSPGTAARVLHLSPGQYWRSGDVVRRRAEHPRSQVSDALVRGGHALVLNWWPGDSRRFLSTQAFEVLGDGDIWHLMMFTFFNGYTPIRARTFSELLAGRHTLTRAERVDVDGQALVRMDLDTGALTLALQFDPRCNHLVRQVDWNSLAPSRRSQFRAVRFTEHGPGVFVPTTIEKRVWENGRLAAHVRLDLADVRVNRPEIANELQLPGIAGLKCVDLDAEKEYTVDADGNRTSEARPKKVYAAVPQPQSDAPAAVRPPSRPPWPWWWYALAAAAAVLLAAGFLLRFARRGG